MDAALQTRLTELLAGLPSVLDAFCYGYANANGYFDFDTNMVAMPAGKLYYRPKLVVKVSSGTGSARVWATIQALL